MLKEKLGLAGSIVLLLLGIFFMSCGSINAETQNTSGDVSQLSVASETSCSSLTDITGSAYEKEICGLVSSNYWQIATGATTFKPNDSIMLYDEIRTILNAVGLGNEASKFSGGLCPKDPYISYALDKKIINASACPKNAKRRLNNVTVDTGRALFTSSQENYNHFWKLVKEYYGPDYTGTTNPFGVSTSYFKLAYNTGALIGWDKNFDPKSSTYGSQYINRAQAAAIIYRILEVGGRDTTVQLPEHLEFLEDAQTNVGLPSNYNVNESMTTGDFIGTAMRLAKNEGCISYEATVENPYESIPDDYEYIPELVAAGNKGIISKGIGKDTTNLEAWYLDHDKYFTRANAAAWMYRVLAKLSTGCKTTCTKIWNENGTTVTFNPSDASAVKAPKQAVCAYVLGGLPLAKKDDQGLINSNYAGVPEAEESLVMLYKMLQVDLTEPVPTPEPEPTPVPEPTPTPEPTPEPTPIPDPYASPSAWQSNADAIAGSNLEDHAQTSRVYIVNMNSVCELSKDLYLAAIASPSSAKANLTDVMWQIQAVADQISKETNAPIALTDRDTLCKDSDFDGIRDFGAYGHNYYGHIDGGGQSNYGDNCRLVYNPSQVESGGDHSFGDACKGGTNNPEAGSLIKPAYLPLDAPTPTPDPTPTPTPTPDPTPTPTPTPDPTPTPTPSGTVTFYVRPNGGTSSQCTGLANTDYSGSGSGQACAFNHPFFVLPPGGPSLLKSGDTLIIASGAYRMGFGAPNTGSCSSYYPWDCNMPAIPSGIDATHPTRILGQGWDSGCSTAPELYGAERAYNIINLTNSNNVEVNCFEITDHSGCVEFHSGSITCKRDSYPFGEWAGTGVIAADSKNVTLKNLNIHGFANTGVHAGRLTDWTIENVRIANNGWVGWDGDITGNDSNTGTTMFKNVTIEYNGCGETWPGKQTTGCWAQSAGGYGDGLGTGATGGTWIFEDSSFLYNTSDGLDLLYHNTNDGKIVVNRVHSEGNAGNQIKTSGNAEITNSIFIGNCGYFQGKSFTHYVDNCRAGGNPISFNFHSGSTVSIVNSTVYSEGDCLLLTDTASCDGSQKFTSLNNIYLAGTDYLQPFETSCFLYATCPTMTFENDYNIIYNVKNFDYAGRGRYPCPIGTHDVCTDPLIGPFNTIGFIATPRAGSPAIDSGFMGTSLIPDIDFFGNARPYGSGIDRGAVEVGK